MNLAGHMNQQLRAKMRKRLLKRDGYKCHWCNNRMTFKRVNDPTFCTIDHVIPRSKGGSNKLRNLVLACKWCNNTRDSKK